tara:strand:+ start:108 stop:1496 length:1389 start_codon:yes stop_codon:yes gene_type:complete
MGPQLFRFTQNDRVGSPNFVKEGFGATQVIARSGESRKNAAPYLEPIGSSGNINVIKDFSWTETPSKGRIEVPRITLKENYVNFNALLQNIRYLLSSAGDTKDAIVDLLSNIDKTTDLLNSTGVDTAKKTLKTLTDPIKKLSEFEGVEDVNQYLRPYYGLYSMTRTGFKYTMPYFTADQSHVSNSWGEMADAAKGFAGDVLESFGTSPIKTTIQSFGQTFHTGAYIETSKSYAYDQNPTSKQFTFYLHNTTNFDDVVRNWHLVFMLIYQNLPNKTSKVLLEPPVIYEVEIPGVYYSPFSYITNLQIENVGAIREMELDIAIAEQGQSLFEPTNNNQNPIPEQMNPEEYNIWQQKRASNIGRTGRGSLIPAGGSSSPLSTKTSKVNTIIPDSYKITINVTSLVPDSKNLMFHTLWNNNSKSKSIHTATRGVDGKVALTKFERELYEKVRENQGPKAAQNRSDL